MAAAKKTPKQAEPEPAAQNQPLYPAIEAFVEVATPEEVAATFEQLKASLAALKGPKAEQSKKIGKAIARAEELLSHLIQVREKLEADRQAPR